MFDYSDILRPPLLRLFSLSGVSVVQDAGREFVDLVDDSL
jgi:hypothetical protein